MARLLLLGPDKERAAGIRSLLRQDGHDVSWVRSVGSWNDREREILPDLVIAAVASADGVLSAPHHSTAGFPPPLLFVQQEADFLGEIYQEERLVDRMSSPFMGEELLGRIDALIRVRRSILRSTPRRRSARDARRRVRGFGRLLTSWLTTRLPPEQKPVGPYLEVAARVADWSDKRDAFKPGHAERVTSFCAMIAEGLRMEEQETSELLRASILHDIGKVAVPVDVLRQKQPLMEAQRRLIRTHPARGAALVRALDPDESVARAVLYHHECPDGSGYYGKEADGIPLTSRVLGVAEAYDAMTSSLLREPLTSQAALDLLESTKGRRYDADCVEALVDQLRPRSTSIPLSIER